MSALNPEDEAICSWRVFFNSTSPVVSPSPELCVAEKLDAGPAGPPWDSSNGRLGLFGTSCG